MTRFLSVLSLCAFTHMSAMAAQTASPEDAGLMLVQWQEAFNACDVEKLTSMYAPNALFWATTATAPISTTDGVRAYFKAVSSGPVKLQMTTDTTLTRAFGDVASLVGALTISFDAQGQSQTRKVRFSLSVQKVDGLSKIVEHHSSMMPAAPTRAASTAN